MGFTSRLIDAGLMVSWGLDAIAGLRLLSQSSGFVDHRQEGPQGVDLTADFRSWQFPGEAGASPAQDRTSQRGRLPPCRPLPGS